MRPEAAARLRGRRVIVVVWTLRFGGHHRQALHLAHHLAENCGASVEVWGLSYPGAQPNMGSDVRVPCRQLELRWLPSRLARLRTLLGFALDLRRARPDVLLSYTHVPNIACGFVFPIVGARSCIWNQRDMLAMGFFGPRTERQAVRQVRRFVANAEHLKSHMLGRYGIRPEVVRVVRNGVEVGRSTRSRETWRAQLGLRNDALVACMVGNLVEGKDHATLLKAWAVVVDRLRREGRDAVLALAGEGALEHTLKAQAFDLGLGGAVRFLGFVDDIPGLLGAADLATFCSSAEGSPNGVLESMAAGLPVVATDIPGVREAVGPAGQDLLVPAGDSVSLADRLAVLLSDSAARRELGSLNAARIADHFSVSAMCREMEAVILEDLGR